MSARTKLWSADGCDCGSAGDAPQNHSFWCRALLRADGLSDEQINTYQKLAVAAQGDDIPDDATPSERRELIARRGDSPEERATAAEWDKGRPGAAHS